jgi:hypothetical protein
MKDRTFIEIRKPGDLYEVWMVRERKGHDTQILIGGPSPDRQGAVQESRARIREMIAELRLLC